MMERTEMVDLLIKLKCAYPLFYSNKSSADLNQVAGVWFEYFGAHPARLVAKAVDLVILRETEVPTIALIQRYLPEARKAIEHEDFLQDEELQAKVRMLRS